MDQLVTGIRCLPAVIVLRCAGKARECFRAKKIVFICKQASKYASKCQHTDLVNVLYATEPN